MQAIMQCYLLIDNDLEFSFMDKYIWLFPVLFIFHDMEEVIGLKKWLRNNKEIFNNKLHAMSEMCNNFTTEGMAAAVFEELILSMIVCIISIEAKWYGLWLGTFIAYTIHLVIHMGQAIIIRKYIPALVTSIICIGPSIYIIKESIGILGYGFSYILLFGIIGIFIVAVNLKFAHVLMNKFNKWIEK